MWFFVSMIAAIAAAPVCRSTGQPPLLSAGQPGSYFECSSRSNESLSCPMYSACEYLEDKFVCCPYGPTRTCNRYAPSDPVCKAVSGCVVTKEYGCMESGSPAATIAAVAFITGTCWHRCGVAGWQSRTFGAPNPNTACSCTWNCWQTKTCCVDFPFFCSYDKAKYQLYP